MLIYYKDMAHISSTHIHIEYCYNPRPSIMGHPRIQCARKIRFWVEVDYGSNA